jgi:hypothetical protein
MKIVTATGETVATVSPTGEWRWVNRTLAPPEFAALVDQPEIEMREGGEAEDGKVYTKFVAHRRNTPGWVRALCGQAYYAAPDLIWQED